MVWGGGGLGGCERGRLVMVVWMLWEREEDKERSGSKRIRGMFVFLIGG